MRKILSLLAVLVISTAMGYSQTKSVTGKVTNEQGEPVPFATVVIKATKAATVSDASGSFTLKAKTGDVLVISAQSFATQEVTIGESGVVSVSLKTSNNALTEVIVTGAYNTKRTARSTSYNAQVVSNEQLNTIRQTNLNSALAGKVSGLQFRGQSAGKLGDVGSVRLRGASGLGGDEGIIYVVDGTILPSINDISTDDIEDLTVLQGPAASAQFGPQGHNGAIVITLKKARKNARGIGVDLNLGAQFDRIYNLPNYQNSYAGGNASDLKKYTWTAGHPEEWKALDGKYYHNYSDDASWGPRMVGQEYIPWYSWYPGTKYTGTTAKLVPQKDNAKDFFNTGINLNNSIAFSKATDNMALRVSYSNVDVKGLLPTTSLKKHTLNTSLSIDLNPHFTVAANVNYFSQVRNGEFNDDYSNQTTGSFNQWFHRNLDMGIMKELKDLKVADGVYGSWNHQDPTTYDAANPNAFYAGNYWYNFYKWFDLVKPVENRDRLFGDISLTYKINSDLRIKATYRKQQNTIWSEAKFYSDLVTSGTQTTGNCDPCKGFYGTNESYSNRQNYELLVTYSKKIKDFAFNANAGSDFFKALSKSNGASTANGLNVPNYFAINNSKDQPVVTNGRSEEKYRALFLKGDIGYRNFAFVDFSLRNDWFSTLPQSDNTVFSKSFGASLVFSDLIKTNWLSYGKLRASWGEIPKALGTTSTDFGAYRYPGFAYGVGQFQWNGNFLMGTPDQLVDSAIHGAVKTQQEIGIDLKFMNNRVGISATYWDGTEKDMPLSVTINGASGFTSKLINAGKITKKGIDLQFNARPVWMNNLKWEINATWGYLLENKVVEIYQETQRTGALETLWGGASPTLVHEVGLQWGQLFGNGIKRINGQPVLTAAGLYVNDPNVHFGSVLPKYTGGIQNSFEILKDFTVNVNIDYQSGGKFFSLSDMWGSYSGLTARTAGVNDKGNPVRDPVADGGGVHVFGVDDTGKPVDYYVDAQDYYHGMYNSKTMDEFIYDLTFVKLREISIGYNIPLKKIGLDKWINRATFSLVARNLWVIYANTKDFDPSEISDLSGETGNLPGTRAYGFNLRVGF
jgi:TonB-linked SusC/RagA family outer membrane protein